MSDKEPCPKGRLQEQAAPSSSNVASHAGKDSWVLSAMRPTGPLHLGHFVGALSNWLRLQNEGVHRCFFFSADWHALTTAYKTRSQIHRYRREMVADWIAVGIDPQKVTLFSQAAVPAHAELSTLLGMLTPLPWLERVPSYKEMRQQLADRDLGTIGFLNYPLLQAADILVYRGTHIPVGEDQLAHVELTREVARRFNQFFGETFAEPKALITEMPRLPGLDGRKMSKSYNNAVYLAEDDAETKPKIMQAPTDPQRVRRSDPGNPEICSIFAYQKILQNEETVAEIDEGCRTAGIGCVDCKKRLLGALTQFREPIQVRRAQALDSGEVDDVLAAGNVCAQARASETMAVVSKAMGL